MSFSSFNRAVSHASSEANSGERSHLKTSGIAERAAFESGVKAGGSAAKSAATTLGVAVQSGTVKSVQMRNFFEVDRSTQRMSYPLSRIGFGATETLRRSQPGPFHPTLPET